MLMLMCCLYVTCAAANLLSHSSSCSYLYFYLAFFPYDGYYSETDRIGTVQKTIPSLKFEASIQRPPPHYHDVYPHPIMATCLYKSALLVAELDSCLHP